MKLLLVASSVTKLSFSLLMGNCSFPCVSVSVFHVSIIYILQLVSVSVFHVSIIYILQLVSVSVFHVSIIYILQLVSVSVFHVSIIYIFQLGEEYNWHIIIDRSWISVCTNKHGAWPQDIIWCLDFVAWFSTINIFLWNTPHWEYSMHLGKSSDKYNLEPFLFKIYLAHIIRS